MLAEDKLWTTKRLAEAKILNDMRDRATRAFQKPPLAPRTTNSNAPTPTSSSTYPRLKTPALTEPERTLLRDHQGCFKCRKFYAGHHRDACSEWPDAATYRTLTPDDASKAKKVWEAGGSKARRTAVAAVNVENTSQLQEIPESPPTVNIGAVYASAFVGAIGTDDEDTWDSEYVNTPLSTPHLILSASITSPSCLLDSIDMLIDTGCPVNLISETTATSLNLRHRPLPTTFNYNDAFGGGQKSSSEWCRFAVVTTDGSYTSRSVRAIIVPDLCYPVLLGTPFLDQNELLVDVHHRSLRDSRSNLDLLNMPQSKPPAKPVTPTHRRALLREREHLEARHQLTQHQDLLRDIHMNVPPTAPHTSTQTLPATIAASVRSRVELLAFVASLKDEDLAFKTRYSDCFPDDIPHLDNLPTNVYHEINLKDANMTIVRRQYDCPRKYREAFKTLLTQHLDAGRLRESSSPYASPCFLVPKADPTALPRWVNDYRVLNENTIPDVYPLPSIPEILSDCARGKIWGKLDMTNSFFQTRVHPDHVKYTAITTPFGLYEWTVMPQGCCNAPSTHQRRMYTALRPYIGSICHVYLDDIIIWSQSLEEHRRNVETILTALRANQLYCSLKKTDLFCTDLQFLGHHISQDGITPDGSKVEKVTSWPTPASAHDVRSFLGLVRYISSFLPHLADLTAILNPLTTKEAEKEFLWTTKHDTAFDAIKRLVVSHECLTSIDHTNMGTNRIFVSTDASDWCTGAVLSYGETLETARPVAFESAQLSGAELNYPVHEKELLAIVRALKKWRIDLLGVPFTVYTDHRTLENFNTQKHLSRR